MKELSGNKYSDLHCKRSTTSPVQNESPMRDSSFACDGLHRSHFLKSLNARVLIAHVRSY